MNLVVQQIHQRPVHPGPLVLRAAPLKYPTPTPDRDRTVSRRSEPSSRTALLTKAKEKKAEEEKKAKETREEYGRIAKIGAERLRPLVPTEA